MSIAFLLALSGGVNMRQGLSLIELVVVIAILAVVSSLALMATISARSSARGFACKNNLRQQAIAVLNFEAANRHFPSNGWGWRWMPGASSNRFGSSGGFFTQLLPMLEAENLVSLPNRELASQPFLPYKCPSRPTPAIVPH